MEWTAENNKATINGLLDDYADLLAVYREFVDQNLDAELPTKLKALQTLKSLATTIELLLKRWSFAYRGYEIVKIVNDHPRISNRESGGPRMEINGQKSTGNLCHEHRQHLSGKDTHHAKTATRHHHNRH